MSEQLFFENCENLEEWRKEWKNMPEFVQEEIKPWKSIIIHFENYEDMKEMADLIGQNLTTETKSFWHPKLTIDKYMDKRWVDQDDKRFTEFPIIEESNGED